MINCDQIAVESAKLKAMFTKCYNLKAIDLRSIVDLIESVSACSGGSFNLKTVNGQSLLGIGNIVVTAVVDGTETKVQQGSGITVTGNGSISSPYVVSNSSIVTVDGSETKINQGSNITIAGTGTVANPYVINAETQSQTPQVNADWASISGASEILNKPAIPSAQGLQEVIDVGGYAEKGNNYIDLLGEKAGNHSVEVFVEDFTNPALNSSLNISTEGVSISSIGLEKSTDITLSNGFSVTEITSSTSQSTTLGIETPISTTTIKLPAKTVSGDYTLATTDEIDAIGLQKVIDTGGFGSFNVDGKSQEIYFLNDGELSNTAFAFSSDWIDNGNGMLAIDNNRCVMSQADYVSQKTGHFGVDSGVAEIMQISFALHTKVKFETPTLNSTLNFPAKTVAGVYTLATTDETVNLTGDQTIEGYKTFQNGQVIIYGGASNPLYIQANNVGAYIENLSTNDGLKIENTSSGDALNINGTTASTGKILKVTNNNVETLNVTKTGNINANSFIKTGGTSTQALMANGSAVQLVTQTITNGVTDKSPSEDAVYDNLANVTRTLIKSTTTGSLITGTISQAILYSQLIPANTFKNGDFFNIEIARIGKVGTVGTLRNTIRINTTNTLTGSIMIADNLGTTNNISIPIQRIFSIEGTNLVGFPASQSASDIVNSSTAIASYAFNPAIDNYIFICGTLSSISNVLLPLIVWFPIKLTVSSVVAIV